jgi:hypothetical protein
MNVFLLVKQTLGVISFKLTTTIGFQETEITIVQGEKKVAMDRVQWLPITEALPS